MTETAMTREDRIRSLYENGDPFGQDSNNMRGARILVAILDLYADGYGGDAESAVQDALTDLRHAADMLGVSFGALDRTAQQHYCAEVQEHGVAQIL